MEKIKIKKCVDCNKKLSSHKKTVLRCRKCYYKFNRGKNSPLYGRRAEKHSQWKGGRPKCKICNKLLSNYDAIYCMQCYNKKGTKNPNYKNGITLKKHYCKDCGKQICLANVYVGRGRCFSCSKKGKLNHRLGKISHGKWGKYKGIHMRSSWEIAYAKHLDKNNIKWEYESKTFNLGNTTYTPDFYLPEKDLYIEVKGYWRPDARKKYLKFKRKYPNIHLLIISKKQMENIL